MNRISDALLSRRLSARFSFGTFYALLAVLTGLAALCFFAESLRFLPAQGDNIYQEAAGVLSAHRWANGLPLYEDYRQSPYLMTAFPPAWYALLAGAAKAGLSDLDALTIGGRVLSLVCVLGIAALAYRWNRRLGFSSRLALSAPLFYLSFPILIPFAVTARPDFPSVFLGLLSLYWGALGSGKGSIFLAATAAAFAFLARHNAVAVPVALVLWLAWSKKWKQAFLFCVVWAAVVVLTLLPFLSSDGLLLLNLSGAKFGYFAFTYVRDVLFRLLITPGHGFAVALFVFGALGLLESWKQRDERVRLLNVYLLVSLGFALTGSAAAGSAANHYLEVALGLALLIPAGLARLESVWERESPFASLAVVFVLALLLPSLDMQRWNWMHRRPEDLRPVIGLTQNKNIFTDAPYLAARTSNPQFLDPPSLINTERVGGWAAWSSAELAETLRMKKYDLVILRKPLDVPYEPAALYPRYPRLDAAMQTAIAQNYQLCFELDTCNVYGRLSEPNFPASHCPSREELSLAGNHLPKAQ